MLHKFALAASRRKFSRSGVSAGTAFSLALFAEYQRRLNRNREKDGGAVHKASSPSLLSSNVTLCDFLPGSNFFRLARTSTIRRMQDTSSKQTLRSKYDVRWRHPLGEGGFGAVYLATDRKSGDLVAVKKISKRFTDDESFQKEMNAFLHIRHSGGHPNICGLRENFDEDGHYFLVLDLVSGGEMFDHLCNNGAYSEADAARLVREVGSALAFLHGTGCVHGDLKPENLMLSSENCSDAVIKVVDFGCAQIVDDSSPFYDHAARLFIAANTPGYSPPEVVDKSKKLTKLDPAIDMFALGVIVYIMLTGVHPFDLSGTSTDDEMNARVLHHEEPPLRNSAVSAHLSPSAIDLIEKLIDWKPKRRLSALQMLNHPWVRGETARTGKIADSDKRLSTYRKYKSRLEAKVFANMVEWSEAGKGDEVAKRTSLIERSFQMLDAERRGYITTKDLKKLDPQDSSKGDGSDDDPQLSLSGFSDLLSENMKNRYFPSGHIIYREGEKGNNMYFINSGRIEVYTKDGFRTVTEQGDFFGEGALLDPRGRRSASIRCVTPVHAIEISREYFEKYLADDGYDTELDLREKDKMRKRNRAKTILSLQKNMTEVIFRKGEYFYKQGEPGQKLYILEQGQADVLVEDHTVFTVNPGELCGEHSLIFGRPRNTSAKCTTEFCRLQVLQAKHFKKLMRSHPTVKESLQDISLRREFQKALVFSTKKAFPTNAKDLRAAFDVADKDGSGEIDIADISLMLKNLDSTFTDGDIKDILSSLDLDGTGAVNWDEFKRIFGISDEKQGAKK